MPWPDGYAAIRGSKFNVAQVPRVDSYRGFIFGTLNPDAPPLLDYLGPITQPIDEWLDRHPGGKVAVCEANRLKYKGNWKLAYDNSGDGYHVVFSHRSLLEMENRQADVANKGMSYYKGSPDSAPMYMAYMGNGHHFKDKRPNIEKRAGGLWAVEGPAPGGEHYAEELRRRYGAKAEDILDLASSEPVNINVFPNLSLLGNHSRCLSRSRSMRPMSPGTAPRSSTRTMRPAGRPGCQRAAHAHAGAVPEFRRGRRSRQFRGNSARSRLHGG